MPAPLTFRPLNPTSDYPALAALYQAVEQADQGAASTTEENLRARTWGVRFVAEDPQAAGSFPAAGWMGSQTPTRFFVFALVDPARRRQGLGRRMLAYVEAQAAAQGAYDTVASADLTDAQAIAFVTRLGYTLAGHDYILALPADVDPGEPRFPAGFTTCTFAQRPDLALLAEAHNRCYRDHFGHYENSQPNNPTRLGEKMAQYPEAFMPEGIFFLFAPNGDLAGISYGRVDAGGQRRTVDSPGCPPEYRHLGLYKPLAQLAAGWLRRTYGPGPLYLDCYGEDEVTIALFCSIGFILEDKDHSVEYRKGVSK